MRTRAAIGIMSMGVAFLTGCSTPKPGQMLVTPRDRETYTDLGASKVQKEEKHRVAILVTPDNSPHAQEVAVALDSALTSVIADFAFFSIVERSNLSVLQKEREIEALNDGRLDDLDIPEADYLITAKINAARIEKHQSNGANGGGYSAILKGQKPGTEAANPYYTASTSVDFRFYEKKTQRVVLAKNIERDAPGNFSSEGSPEAIAKLTVAAQECAKVFAMELGSRYAPPARVVEVRGNGKVAKVTMGSNYGLAKGVKVMFFEYVDNSDVIEGATREPSPVGYGTVLESDISTAWIEVLAPNDVIVKRGHYVKITSDQSKGLKEKIPHLFRVL